MAVTVQMDVMAKMHNKSQLYKEIKIVCRIDKSMNWVADQINKN